ncbi:MAG: hypothetical protein K2L45_06025 [Muribaculaceae bacterium]|nr:hypothetical protein [Muribaculaceae bacterium]
MKKLLNSLLVLLMLSGISSCKNDLDPLEAGHNRNSNQKNKPMLKTVRMSFGGDYISESEEPLLRAEDGETFVGINVFYTKKDVDNAEEENYAYGLFKNTSGIKIDLITGYTYRFEASILIEREDKLWENEGRYGQPFQTSNGLSDFYKKDIGSFIYTYEKESKERFYFRQLKSGIAMVDAGSDLSSRYGDVSFPRVKRYYGSIGSFDPSAFENIEIKMEYKCFGLKLVLESIPDNTSLSVRDITNIGNTTDPKYRLVFPANLRLSSSDEQSKTWEGIYSLSNFNDNTHEFKLRFTWYKGNGDPETFDHTFTVEATKKKVLNIKIDGEVNSTKSGNIIFTNLEDELEDDIEDISNIKDDE